jgi:putative hydrolase of the HAD superfamily
MKALGTLVLSTLRAVLFDFGGVLAEEGFREGLKAVGRQQGLDPECFYDRSSELVYSTGFITGRSDERFYWEALRTETGIKGTDAYLREEILKRFTLRPEMLALVDRIRSSGLRVAILSDQTNWLDELNQRSPFAQHVDRLFNSFHLGKSKRDPSLYADVCRELGVEPKETLFIDDNQDNIARASTAGLYTLHCKEPGELMKELKELLNRRSRP